MTLTQNLRFVDVSACANATAWGARFPGPEKIVLVDREHVSHIAQITAESQSATWKWKIRAGSPRLGS